MESQALEIVRKDEAERSTILPSAKRTEQEIDFLERLLREPDLREKFKKDPTRTSRENGVTFSPSGERALMNGLSDAIALFSSPQDSTPATETSRFLMKHPFAPPGDIEIKPGPQGVLVLVQAVTSVVQAVATVVVAAAAVYAASSTKPK